MKKEFLIVAFIVAISAACEKEATIKLPESSEKLVVCSFLSPHDSLISVSVRTSKPRFGNTWEPHEIEDAHVRISGAGKTVTVPYTYHFALYTISHTELPVIPGQTYTLEVSATGLEPVRAITTVPADSLSITSTNVEIIDESENDMHFTYSFEVADLPGQTNYVGLFHRVMLTFHGTIQDGQYFDIWGGEFVDDEFQQQTSYQRKGATEYADPDKRNETWVLIEVLNCSRDFYLYNRSLQQAAGTGGNPFADPVLIHTNIQGGFGCFGSFYRTRRIVGLQ